MDAVDGACVIASMAHWSKSGRELVYDAEIWINFGRVKTTVGKAWYTFTMS